MTMGFRRYAVVLAGGAGERFWPVSRSDRPKQFLRLTNKDKSLLAEAAERARSLVGADRTLVATGESLASASRSELPWLAETNTIAEPARRNTAAALIWAAAHVMARDPEWPTASMAVLTADHGISPEPTFLATVGRAMDFAEAEGAIVTIGIRPDRAETGYGYIELADPSGDAFWVERFTEKPDAATASAYLAGGRHLWNSGMFFWTLATFVAEFERADPEYGSALRSIAASLKASEFDRAKEAFMAMKMLSIDYALMEKASRVAVVPSDFAWDDLGSWDALSRSLEPDTESNVSVGDQECIDSSGNVSYVDGTRQKVFLLGVSDLIVVVTDGQVMVCPKDRAQEIRRFSQKP